MAGAFFGVFVVLNSLLGDAGSLLDRIVVFAQVAAVFAISGAVFGYLSPQNGWKWGLWLGGPSLVIIVLYNRREPAPLLYLLYVSIIFLTACAGANYGALRKTRLMFTKSPPGENYSSRKHA